MSVVIISETTLKIINWLHYQDLNWTNNKFLASFCSPAKLHAIFALEPIPVDWLLKYRFNSSWRIQAAKAAFAVQQRAPCHLQIAPSTPTLRETQSVQKRPHRTLGKVLLGHPRVLFILIEPLHYLTQKPSLNPYTQYTGWTCCTSNWARVNASRLKEEKTE